MSLDDVARPEGGRTIQQTIQIVALAEQPAAGRGRCGERRTQRRDPCRHALGVARQDARPRAGDLFTVISRVPELTPTILRAAGNVEPARTRSSSNCPTTFPTSWPNSPTGHDRRSHRLRQDDRPADVVPGLRLQPRGAAGPRRQRDRVVPADPMATASSSRRRSRRWPGRSASRRGSPSGSRRAR